MKEQRLIEMDNYIREQRICTIEQLCAHFDVSISTARRDIAELVKQKCISKVHGGVKTLSQKEVEIQDSVCSLPNELDFFPQMHRIEYLDRIARAASAEVNDNEIIILGSGYTTYHMLKYLKSKKNLVIITNNLLIAYEALNSDFKMVLLGGDVNKETFSIVGVRSSEMLTQLNAHKAFLGCNGIMINQGFSNFSELETAIKRSIIDVSKEVFVLAAHDKFDNLSLNTFAKLEEVNALITDEPPAKEYLEYFEKIALRCIIAK